MLDAAVYRRSVLPWVWAEHIWGIVGGDLSLNTRSVSARWESHTLSCMGH